MTEKTVPVKKDGGDIQATREDARYLIPAVDIFETENELVVICDVPGVDQAGISVGVDENILTIEGRTLDREEDLSKEIHREYRLSNYHRQFELSDVIDQEKISAELKHGVLTITLPKAEKAKPKKIDIKVNG
ncbi:Hsp20/alpha crystallin family protein [bacterium]|nr:Hsp20/alpha crystallin family protein [candidate division CSSED10-310 bacterium]